MWKFCNKVANRFDSAFCASAVILMVILSQWATADTIVKDGIKVDFTLTSAKGLTSDKRMIEGSDALFDFNITDAGGEPLSGAYPAAWMQRRAETIPSNDKICKSMVKTFIGGSLLSQPTLNLNTYYVLVMNDDATISVVDPLFHFGGTNLLTMVPLSSPGYDWQMSETQQRLFISLPKTKRLAIVDTISFKLVTELAVSGIPGDVALQPDQHYLWVSYQGEKGRRSGVEVINTLTNKKVKRFELGPGPHHFAFSPDNQHVFIADQQDNNVTVIDVAQMQVAKTLATSDEPSAIAYSSAADAVYVTHRGDGKVVSINARTLTVNGRIDLVQGKGIEHLRFAPNGRHAVVVNPSNDKIYVLDSLNDTISKHGKVESGPDQVNFSDTLAYIRHRSSETILMIPMDSIINKDVALQVVDFPGGETGFGMATTPAAGIVQAPGENAVLVAHPKDQQIYYYKEGMAAPMGSFKNYSRNARAVIAVDRSLREGEGGQYQTVGRLAEAGTYDVAFFMDSPRVVHCFEVRVMPNPEQPKNTLQSIMAVLIPGQKFNPGEPATLTFRLQDRVTGLPLSGLKQLKILSVLTPGMWKNRSVVTEVGQGVYSTQWRPPESGAYYIQLDANWDKLKMYAPRHMMLQVM